ncbi:MAG: rane protein [Pseudomonas sp.]|nr:rane protein [Pseudomonas sp.]
MSPLVRLLASFVALMLAMGIGRYALTPQMPHLLSEGQVDLTAAGLLAAANYLGYLVGAVDGIFARRAGQINRRLRGGLWLSVLLTLASFWAHSFWPHAILRFGTGIASAWVLVMITGLSQHLALAANRPRLGALVFAGPGLGIMLTGVLALGSNLMGQPSGVLWLIYAAVGLLMLVAILPALPQPHKLVAEPVQQAAKAPHVEHHKGLPRLVWAYGLVGLGYILPATFLSQMASAQFQGQWQADLFWPAFGLAAAIGVLITAFRPASSSTLNWLIATLVMQAAGVFACLLPSGLGLTLGVLLCGGPFLGCMQLVMQRSRELAPHATQRNAGVLTTCFALGQLGGPLVAALSSHLSGGLQPALIVAGLGLLLGAGLLLLPVNKVAMNEAVL